ncbi:hypothetical protein [Citrobacter phage Ci1]|nr:hypothetical protein [Citrobacter phage Ci1]
MIEYMISDLIEEKNWPLFLTLAINLQEISILF